jgi:protein SCO1/2
MKLKYIILILFISIIFSFAALALAQVEDSDKPASIQENLGGYIPMDLTFTDEHGDTQRLGDLIDRPTVISLVYLSCRDMCPLLLRGISDVVGKLDTPPGAAYSVLTISFDEFDTTSDAMHARETYTLATQRKIDSDQWHFLTGSKENIKTLADSMGFYFKREEVGFSHPMAVMVLSPDGKIVRYLYGATFLPFNLKMAITEGAAGRIGQTASRVLLYCFSYDPTGKTYVFNSLKVVGTLMLLLIISLFVYLKVTTKKYRKTSGEDDG